jgi:hypothetical protein
MSLPNTPERDSEEDDVWERLRQLGLEWEGYLPPDEPQPGADATGMNGCRTGRNGVLLVVLVDIEPDVRMGTSRQFGFVNTTPLIVTIATPNGQESPRSVARDYWRRLRRRSHSPRAERIKVKPPSPPSAQSVQTKKKPPGDLAISP